MENTLIQVCEAKGAKLLGITTENFSHSYVMCLVLKGCGVISKGMDLLNISVAWKFCLCLVNYQMCIIKLSRLMSSVEVEAWS